MTTKPAVTAESEYEQFKRYTATWNYKELLKKHSLDQVGTWVVRGEDPNCDLGGNHVMPVLGHFQGRLVDVIRHAVMLPGFWQWGAGGDFRLIKIVDLTPDSFRGENI